MNEASMLRTTGEGDLVKGIGQACSSERVSFGGGSDQGGGPAQLIFVVD